MSFEANGLSREELRELLGDAALEDEAARSGWPGGEAGAGDLEARGRDDLLAAEGAALPPRILVAGRRRSENTLLRERLERLGARVDVVRNAFSALDLLRAGSHDAVVTDLDLWATHGTLLEDRVGARQLGVPVLLLADRGRDAEPILRGRAWRVLRRPLGSAEMESALRDLLEGAARAAGARGASPGRARREDQPEGAQGGGAPGPRAGEANDLVWLRFVVEGHRLRREGSADAARLARLARGALGALAAGVFVRRGEDSWAHLEAREGGAGADGFTAVIEASQGRGGNDDLVVDFAAGCEGSLVLTGLPEAVHAAAPAFLDDARFLLTEWFGRG
jgi:CheY-like chemotaxis protein